MSNIDPSNSTSVTRIVFFVPNRSILNPDNGPAIRKPSGTAASMTPSCDSVRLNDSLIYGAIRPLIESKEPINRNENNADNRMTLDSIFLDTVNTPYL
jgi:hypothetical protein